MTTAELDTLAACAANAVYAGRVLSFQERKQIAWAAIKEAYDQGLENRTALLRRANIAIAAENRAVFRSWGLRKDGAHDPRFWRFWRPDAYYEHDSHWVEKIIDRLALMQVMARLTDWQREVLLGKAQGYRVDGMALVHARRAFKRRWYDWERPVLGMTPGRQRRLEESCRIKAKGIKNYV